MIVLLNGVAGAVVEGMRGARSPSSEPGARLVARLRRAVRATFTRPLLFVISPMRRTRSICTRSALAGRRARLSIVRLNISIWLGTRSPRKATAGASASVGGVPAAQGASV